MLKNIYCTFKIVYSAKLSFNKGKYNNLYKKQAHEGFTERFSLKELIKDLVQEIEKGSQKEVEMQKWKVNKKKMVT